MDKKTFIEGIAVGAVAGAIAGLLLAPKSGEELRNDIKEDLMEIKDQIVERLKKLDDVTQEKYDVAMHVRLYRKVERTTCHPVVEPGKNPGYTCQTLGASCDQGCDGNSRRGWLRYLKGRQAESG